MVKYIKRSNAEIQISNKELNQLAKRLDISPVIAEVLFNRGLTKEEVENYVNPKREQLHDPFLFTDMQIAVDRTWEAIKNNEHIVIWGDFDCDGVSATSSMYLEMVRNGANVSYYIPDRLTEGYGVNKDGIKRLKNERGVGLIITVDCGITSNEEIQYAKELGIDFIVTDHHRADLGKPDAFAVINPKVDERYPFDGLCGAGVAAKFVQAMFGEKSLFNIIDIVTMATVADLVPLVDENRAIVSMGLWCINQVMRPAFIEMTNVLFKEKPDEIKAYHFGFYYGAMINAGGRLGNSTQSVEMMVTNDPVRRREIAVNLYNYNEKRKEIENSILQQAKEKLKKVEVDKCIVVYNEGWEPGVVGIVASRLIEEYNLPTIVLSYIPEENIYRGSARSIPGIDLYEALKSNEQYLGAWGGHAEAAGLTVVGNIDDFINSMNDYLNKNYNEEDFQKKMFYDLELSVDNVDFKLINDLEKIEPSGIGNPKVVFKDSEIKLRNVKEIGEKGDHYNGFVEKGDKKVKVIAFNSKIPPNLNDLDILYQPNINTWQGRSEVQINLKNVKDNSSSKKIQKNCVNLIKEGLNIEEIIDSKAKVKQFKDEGIETALDLIHYIPKSYDDLRYFVDLNMVREVMKKIDEYNRKVELEEDKKDPIFNLVGYMNSFKLSGGNVFAQCVDRNGERFSVTWFNQPYIVNELKTKRLYSFCGKVTFHPHFGAQISPTYFSDDINEYRRIVGRYKKIKGMSNDYLTNSIEKAFKSLENIDYLEADIKEEFGLRDLVPALKQLHYPNNEEDIEEGIRRLDFDKMFKFNFKLKELSFVDMNQSFVKISKRDLMDEFVEGLPFKLTEDQNKTVESFYDVMKEGVILDGLVQGDVGSGKTIVSFIPMILLAENGYQSTLIAPTEVLAKQHYDEMIELTEGMDLNIEYLSGAVKEKDKKVIKEKMIKGEVDIVIGTQALMQKDIEFEKLGLVIIDEQQRFGVEQREMLIKKAQEIPHSITMSATPIPRTLSMAMYGDYIKIFNIKSMPSGRKPIKTDIMMNDKDIYEFIYKEINKGRQAYVVCPLIEVSHSETLSDIKSLEEEYEDITNYFKKYPEVKIEMISGKMKQDEIKEKIGQFENGEVDILLSTTIIEVGVNVPNASVIAIKGSDRFGLAQLHQLRGRVGRGQYQSYCILQPTKDDDVRANILKSTTDGFKIADEDLKLRGSGDYFGLKQSGRNEAVELMMDNTDLYNKISLINDRIYRDKDRFSKYKWLIEKE